MNGVPNERSPTWTEPLINQAPNVVPQMNEPHMTEPLMTRILANATYRILTIKTPPGELLFQSVLAEVFSRQL